MKIPQWLALIGSVVIGIALVGCDADEDPGESIENHQKVNDDGAEAAAGAFEAMRQLAGGGEPTRLGSFGQPRRIYGTVSASKRIGTLERGEYRIHAEGAFEARYNSSLRAWEGRSDAITVSLNGRQRLRIATGGFVDFTMKGEGRTDGSVEFLLEDDGTYGIRFFSDPIEYTRDSARGPPEQRQGGAIATSWGLTDIPMPPDGISFSGSGVYLDPDEEGMTDRSRTELSWSFSTTPPAN